MKQLLKQASERMKLLLKFTVDILPGIRSILPGQHYISLAISQELYEISFHISQWSVILYNVDNVQLMMINLSDVHFTPVSFSWIVTKA